MNDWTEDIDNVLHQIRVNSEILSKEHNKRYFYLHLFTFQTSILTAKK